MCSQEFTVGPSLQPNLNSIPTTCFFNLSFNIVFPSMPGSYKCLSSHHIFQPKLFTSISPMCATCCATLARFWLHYCNNGLWATGPRNHVFDFWQGHNIISFPKCPNQLWGSSGLLFSGCWKLLLLKQSGCWNEAEHTPLSSAKVKNA